MNCDFKNDDSDLTNIIDIDLLKLSGDWKMAGGLVSLSAGRFSFSDFSGSVFSQTSDGVYVAYDTLKFKASAYAGYTGLLNRLNVSMIENEYEKDEQIYALCPKYIPVLADFSYKALFDTNTAGFQAAFYIPAEDDKDIKAYGTFILNGYIGNLGSYDAKLTLGTEKFDGIMLDAKLDASYFVGTKAMLTAGVEYVSGKQGDIKPFMTLSERSFGNAPFYNGVFVPKIAAMYTTDKLYIGGAERIIVSMPEDDAKLDGFDTTINVIYNLYSDLQLGCDIGAYICKEEKELSNYYATIKASLAF